MCPTHSSTERVVEQVALKSAGCTQNPRGGARGMVLAACPSSPAAGGPRGRTPELTLGSWHGRRDSRRGQTDFCMQAAVSSPRRAGWLPGARRSPGSGDAAAFSCCFWSPVPVLHPDSVALRGVHRGRNPARVRGEGVQRLVEQRLQKEA